MSDKKDKRNYIDILSGSRELIHDIFHDITTPLVVLENGMKHIENFFSRDMTAQTSAGGKEANNDIEEVLAILKPSLYYLSQHLALTKLNIDSGSLIAAKYNAQNYSIHQCLQRFQNTYPYKSEYERNQLTVECKDSENFMIQVDIDLFCFALTNIVNFLLRYMDSIADNKVMFSVISNNGKDTLSVSSTVQFNIDDTLALFIHEMDNVRTDLGVGLFCAKMIMGTFGGELCCLSGDDRHISFLFKF